MAKKTDKHVNDLEAKLAEVIKERDELQRDVETLCMQTGSSIWSSSYVLSERIYSLEKELARAKEDLFKASNERDLLKEDILHFKNSKRTVDNSWKAEVEKNKSLEKELSFYQQQSARAMNDRDRAVYEAEELREANLHLEKQLRDAQATADYEQAEKAECQRELANCRVLVGKLEQEAAVAAEVPTLKSKLTSAEGRIQELLRNMHDIQARLGDTTAQLVKAHGKLQETETTEQSLNQELKELHAASQGQIQGLEQRVKELQASIAAQDLKIKELEGRSSKAETALGAAEQKHKVATDVQKSEIAALENKVSELEERVRTLESEVEHATKVKMETLMRLEEEQKAHSEDASQMDTLKRMMNDMKVKLAQATQEKVDAVMRLASNTGESSASSTPSSSQSPSRSVSLQHKSDSAASTRTSTIEDDIALEQLQADFASLKEKMDNVERLVAATRKLKQQLLSASKGIWESGGAASQKVLAEISSLDEECGRWRESSGAGKRLAVDKGAMADGSVRGGNTSKRVDKQAAIEMFDLVDFGIHSLRRYNEQTALNMLDF